MLPVFFAVLLIPGMARGSGKSSAEPYIGIHAEGDEHDGPRMVRPNTINGKTHYFRISPEVVTRHFEAFHAFVAEDGGSYGAALRLNDEGRRAMSVMVTTNQGRLARTIVNGKALDIIRIDRTSEDGYFIVWGGLNPDDLKLMAKKLKRLDSGVPGEHVKEEKEKKKKKKKDQEPG
jgi:hypothetical protein